MADYLRRLNHFRTMNSSPAVKAAEVGNEIKPLVDSPNHISINTFMNKSKAGDIHVNENNSSNEVIASPSSTSSKVDIDVRKTTVKKVPLTRLVWAPCRSLKGGGSYLCARICDIGEGATEFIEDGKWPMRDDEVLVEYFSLPSTLLKVDVVLEKSIVPYYENPHMKKNKDGNSSNKRSRVTMSETEENDMELKKSQWNEEGIEEILTVLRKRFSKTQSEKLRSGIVETAESFLKLALEEKEWSKKVKTSDSKSVHHVTQLSNHFQSKDVISLDDLSKYTKKKTDNMPRLYVGDQIEYFHKIFRNQRILSVIEHMTLDPPSIKVKTGDILEAHDLITRGEDSGTVNEFTINISNEKDSKGRLKKKAKTTSS